MQIVNTLCDICHAAGEDTVADETKIIQVGRKAIEVDICQSHSTDLDIRLEIFFEVGRRPGNVSLMVDRPSKPGKTSTGEFACDRCTRSFPSLQGLAMHRTRTHKIPSDSKEAQRKRALYADKVALPDGMTLEDADRLLAEGVCILDERHGPFPSRASAGSHIRSVHQVSLKALGLAHPPGGVGHAK